MAKRMIRVMPIKKLVELGHRARETQNILNSIRSKAKLWIFKTYKTEPERASPSADDWQRFKKNFVDTYGNETVQQTGMTHSEFIDWFKTGRRECDVLPRDDIWFW